jgi:hypothetical protein
VSKFGSHRRCLGRMGVLEFGAAGGGAGRRCCGGVFVERAEESLFDALGGAGEGGLGGVDVAFGDRGLGVAGAHLHVAHGVAGGGVVGEGGVAEVVEGPECSCDAGVGERGFEVEAGELGRVERCALVRVGEDEVLVSLVAAVLPIVGEQVAGAGAELDRAFGGA